MVDKVWVGKKVQVLSLEELEKNHFKDEEGYFWDNESEYIDTDRLDWFVVSLNSSISPGVRDVLGKVYEVSEINATWFKLKEDPYDRYWELWMVKELISIQDVLDSE